MCVQFKWFTLSQSDKTLDRMNERVNLLLVYVQHDRITDPLYSSNEPFLWVPVKGQTVTSQL